MHVAFAPSASVVISYSKLLAQDQPERASLSVPARFPAHQMDAPLLEALEGSGVFCFNWRARADSYGAVFIREGLEGECWNSPPDPTMNIKHNTITAF